MCLGTHHVQSGNPFGDGNHQFDTGISRFTNRASCEGGRDENTANISAVIDRFGDCVPNRQVKALAATLAWRHAADNGCVVVEHLPCMELAVAPCNSLDNYT